MEKITRMTMAASTAHRWHEQYKHLIGSENDKDCIYKALLKLGAHCSPIEVAKVIGNDSWTTLHWCDECGTKPDRFIILAGEEPDYESNTIYLCSSCISKLNSLVDE